MSVYEFKKDYEPTGGEGRLTGSRLEMDDAVAEPLVAEGTIVKVDLDKEQSDRVSVVSQKIVESLVDGLIPVDGKSFDLGPLEITTLKYLLEGDLNMATEVPMAFQFATGGVVGITHALQECVYDERHTEAEYADAAKAILSLIAEAQLPLSDSNATKEASMALKPQLEALFADRKLSRTGVKYVMSSIFSTFDTLRAGVEKSLEESMERAQAKAFGVETMKDVTVGKLDAYLNS